MKYSRGIILYYFVFFQAEDGIRDLIVTGVQTCALPIFARSFVALARQKIEQSLIEGKKALADAEQTLVKKSKECAVIADDYVLENPWSAVGIAGGLGLVLGLLIRGK